MAREDSGISIAWFLESGSWADQTKPTVDETKHALNVLQGFISRANQIVHNETDQWRAEFQSALQQIDEYAKTQPKRFEDTTYTIKISNPDRLAGAWAVSINGGPEETGTGDSRAFRVAPGPIIVRFKSDIKDGADGGKTRPYATETGDQLTAGTPKTWSITLPTA